MGTEKQSRKGLALRVGSCVALAAVAATAIGMGSLAKYNQSIGVAGTDNDGNAPRVAEFFFTGNVSVDGGEAKAVTDLDKGISLFSTAYFSKSGTAKALDGTDTQQTVKSNGDKVVAPGTHGGLSIAMQAGSGAGQSHAETDAIVSLDVKQLNGSDAASSVPIIYGVDVDGDGDEEYFASKDIFQKDKAYKINDPTGLGGSTTTPVNVSISGTLEDLAEFTKYYYKANGDKFYKMANGGNSVADVTDTAGQDTIDYDINWYWAYEIEDTDTTGDAVDTALAKDAHTALHGEADAQTAAKVAASLKLSIGANAVQVD